MKKNVKVLVIFKPLMLVLVLIALIALFVFPMTSSSARENSDQRQLCSVYNAIYSSVSSAFSNVPQKFELTIDENEEFSFPSEPKAFFTLKTYDADSSELLSTFKFPYACSQGIVTCSLTLSSKPPFHSLGVLALSDEAMPVSLFEKPAPYAITIPDLPAHLRVLDWDTVDNFEYNTRKFEEEKLRPGIFVPPIWHFQSCDNLSANKGENK